MLFSMLDPVALRPWFSPGLPLYYCSVVHDLVRESRHDSRQVQLLKCVRCGLQSRGSHIFPKLNEALYELLTKGPDDTYLKPFFRQLFDMSPIFQDERIL